MPTPPKFKNDLIKTAGLRAQQKAPGTEIIVLVDEFTGLGAVPHYDGWRIINCEQMLLEDFHKLDFSANSFVYACDNDDIGGPFVAVIINKGGIFIPVESVEKSNFMHLDAAGRRALTHEMHFQHEHQFSKWDSPEFFNLVQAIHLTKELPGCYVEVGCFNGSSGGIALRYMLAKNIARSCWFFDVFEGFNYDDAKTSADRVWEDTHKTHGYAVVRDRLKAYADPTKKLEVEVQKANIITDELPAQIDKIALANVDVDLYEAVLFGLRKVSARMLVGGIIIAEDAGATPLLIGARVALEKFLEEEGHLYMPILMIGQTFLIRMR